MGFKLGIMPKTEKILLAERKIILIFYIIYFSLVWHCRDKKKRQIILDRENFKFLC